MKGTDDIIELLTSHARLCFEHPRRSYLNSTHDLCVCPTAAPFSASRKHSLSATEEDGQAAKRKQIGWNAPFPVIVSAISSATISPSVSNESNAGFVSSISGEQGMPSSFLSIPDDKTVSFVALRPLVT